MQSKHYGVWPKNLPYSLPASPESVYKNLVNSAKSSPSTVAIKFYGKELTFSDLYKEVQLIAGYLFQIANIRENDRVALYMQNSPQFVISYYAILAANAVIVPVNPMCKSAELAHVVNDSQSKAIIFGDELYNEIINANLKIKERQLLAATYSNYIGESADIEIPASVTIRSPTPTCSTWQTALELNLSTPDHNRTPDDWCIIPYSSGTTGQPKGCLHTHKSVNATIFAYPRWVGVKNGSQVLATLPLCHVTGMQHSMNLPILTASTIHLMTRWNAQAAAQIIENEKNGVLSRRNAQQKQHIATLERDVQSYKQQAKAALQAMADESKRTGETNHNLTDKLQKLHDEIHKSNDEASTLKHEIEAAHEHEERLLAKREQAFKNEKIALKAALNNVKKEKERLQREVNEQKRNIETLTEKFHNAQHELKILRVSAKTVKQEHTHEILRRASSQVMSSFQKQKHHKFLEKTKKMESEKQGKIKQLMKDLNAMEEEFKDSEEKNKSLEAELSNLKRKHFKLEADGVKDRTLMNETIESLKRERSKLDDEYNNNIEKLKINLKDTKLNLTKIKKNAEERDRNTLLDNARRDSELEINESKLKALYQDIEKVKLEKANAIHEKDILKQEYEQELATLQNLLSTAQRDSARLHTKCQEIEARNISTIDAKDQEIERQQERVKDMKSAMMQLKQEHENKLFENRKSIDVLKTQLESLQLQRGDYVKNLEKMKENQENAERKAQLEVDSVEKNLTDLVRQRTDQLANKNIELEQIKTQMVQTERMLMDERRSTSKLRHQYEEEKERRLNLLKSHESSSESVQSLLSRLQTQEKEMKGIEVKLKESKRAHETTAKAHLENVRHLKNHDQGRTFKIIYKTLLFFRF